MSNRASMPSSRGRRVKVDVVQRKRSEKGWTQEILGKRAGVSTRTIESLEAGSPVALHTIACVAKALDVEISSILADEQAVEKTGQPAAPGETVRISLTVDVPYNKFDQSYQLFTLLMQMADAAGTKAEIGVVSIREGSVVIEAEVIRSDVHALLRAFNDGKLDDFDLTKIAVPGRVALGLVPPAVVAAVTALVMATFWAVGLTPFSLLPIVSYFSINYRNLNVSADFRGNVVFTRKPKSPPPPRGDGAPVDPPPYRDRVGTRETVGNLTNR